MNNNVKITIEVNNEEPIIITNELARLIYAVYNFQVELMDIQQSLENKKEN